MIRTTGYSPVDKVGSTGFSGGGEGGLAVI